MSEAIGLAQPALPRMVFATERTLRRENALDRALVDLQARLWTPFARSRARWLARIVPKVGAHAERLRALDDESLRALARDARLGLRRRARPREEDVALS